MKFHETKVIELQDLHKISCDICKKKECCEEDCDYVDELMELVEKHQRHKDR